MKQYTFVNAYYILLHILTTFYTRTFGIPAGGIAFAPFHIETFNNIRILRLLSIIGLYYIVVETSSETFCGVEFIVVSPGGLRKYFATLKKMSSGTVALFLFPPQ